MTIKEIRQLDTPKKRKWYDATLKELNSLKSKNTFTRMTAKDVYDTFWRNGIRTTNLPSRMVYAKKPDPDIPERWKEKARACCCGNFEE